MAKGMYATVGGVTKKIKKTYCVIGGVAKKIKKIYAVVGGVTRLVWSGSGTVKYYGKASNTTSRRYRSGATTIGNYALIGGGYYAYGNYNTIDTYNTSLVKGSAPALTAGTEYPGATTVGNYALFAGGWPNSGGWAGVESYNTSLTKSTETSLKSPSGGMGVTTIGGTLAAFIGGENMSGTQWWSHFYNTSLTQSTGGSTSVDFRGCNRGCSIGNYGIFPNAYNPHQSTMLKYNTSGTRSTLSASAPRGLAGTTSNANYAVIAGGQLQQNGTVTNTVEAYNASGTRINIATLTTACYDLRGTSVNGFCIFGGGKNGSYGEISDINCYDESLTKIAGSLTLSESVEDPAAVSVGNYALFVSGYGTSSGYYYGVDVFTVEQ